MQSFEFSGNRKINTESLMWRIKLVGVGARCSILFEEISGLKREAQTIAGEPQLDSFLEKKLKGVVLFGQRIT